MEQPIITAFDDYGALECCDAICPTRDPYFTIVVFMNNCVKQSQFLITMDQNHRDVKAN